MSAELLFVFCEIIVVSYSSALTPTAVPGKICCETNYSGGSKQKNLTFVIVVHNDLKIHGLILL